MNILSGRDFDKSKKMYLGRKMLNNKYGSGDLNNSYDCYNTPEVDINESNAHILIERQL